jgi:acyl dehydratase
VPIDPGAVGAELKGSERSWSSTDCLLYALGVGAGVDELAFTTENSQGIEQRALPTMVVILGGMGGGLQETIGEFDWAGVLHAEQGFELHRPLPVEGQLRTTARVAAIWDKGKGALVVIEAHAVDAAGDPLYSTRSSVYIRGEGGWGGERGPSGKANTPPDRAPDHVITYSTRPDQALLYRLNGDRNPLHSDPTFAQRAGFDRPILHGLCTYGFTGRALLHALCNGDPDRFKGMEGRFSAPVLPGDDLTVNMWVEDGEAVFQTARTDGTVVFDGGRCRFA